MLEGEVGRLSEEIEKEFQWRKEAVLGKEALLQELKDLQCRLLHAETQVRLRRVCSETRGRKGRWRERVEEGREREMERERGPVKGREERESRRLF